MVNKKSFLLSLLLFSTLIIYSVSFRNQFIWDDFHLITNDKTIRSVQNLPVIFKSHLFEYAGGSNFYRPVETVSFMFDYALWKLKPFGYHLTNTIFHLLNILLIYFFISHIFKNSDIGFLTSLIFAVHPINTEAVTYISGRADLLGAFLFLAALLCYAKFKDRDKNFLFFLSVLFFALSLLAKESVLIFPLVLILYDALILNQTLVNKKSLISYAPYFFIIALYILFRLFYLGLPLTIPAHIPFKSFLLTTPKILILYVGLLFFPISLHMERIEPVVNSILDPQAVIPLITLLCVIWLLKILYDRSKLLFFCAGFFSVTLLPLLNILTLNAPMAEHWLYLPSIGVYSAVAFGLERILDLKKPMIQKRFSAKVSVVIFICFLSFFSIRTVLRNIEWGKPLEFYVNMLKDSPDSAKGHLNLGSLYISSKNFRLARQEFQKAVILNPLHPVCYYGLGYLDYVDNNKPGAFRNWKIALDIAPFYTPAHEIMTKALYIENKRFRRLVKAVEISPKNIMANYRLAKLCIENSLYVEGLDKLERILELDPKNFPALFTRAGVYTKLGLYTKAIEEYKKLLVLAPSSPAICRNLEICYEKLNGKKDEPIP